ncbi:MAG: Mov34/MPN/PAD-1 family protein [Acidobacteriia bacterium]|nr:Mov34/MPN/PAD-1 family protein [Terriglobia bacterium]
MKGRTDSVREVCYIVSADGNILWRDDGTTHAIADSRARWEAMWNCRAELAEIAHTHPAGPLAFSNEDETTMQAIWAALGRDVIFSVVTPTAMIRTSARGGVEHVKDEPGWVRAIRSASELSGGVFQ